MSDISTPSLPSPKSEPLTSSTASSSSVWKDLIPEDQKMPQQLMSQIASMPKPLPQVVSPLQPLAPQRPPQASGGFGSFSGPTGPIDSSNKAVAAALGFRGTPYAWGGTSRSGLDCSGLVQDVYGSLGVKLPRTTYEQARMGQGVNGIGEARPGDLVFFHDHGHVGIYAGNGMMIDANHTGGHVDVRPIGGYGPISDIRRIM